MTENKKTIYGLILAGGFSKRLGQDKALIEFHDKPQVVHAYDLLSVYCDKVFVSGRVGQQFFNLPVIADAEEYANIGPLGGILSAMQKFPNVAWLLLACDLPYVKEATLDHLIKNRDVARMATAYISSTDNLPEPLCAIWEQESQEKIKILLKEGIQCPRKILIKSDVHLITLPDARWLFNVNTPRDLEGYSKETVS